jgi:hypothetical protein
LDKVYAAEEKVLAAANVTAMKLEAYQYYYAPAGAVGVAGICAKPTPEILKLQADITARHAAVLRAYRRSEVPDTTAESPCGRLRCRWRSGQARDS